MFARAVSLAPSLALVFWLFWPLTPAVASGTTAAEPWNEPKFGDLVAIVAIVVGAGTFWLALYQANQAQKWKRKEFVASQVDKFFSNPAVRRAKLILDYSARRMNLSDDKSATKLHDVMVKQDLAGRALIPHTYGKETFTSVEVAIRDIFDEFLDGLESFYPMVEVNLIKVSDIKPYLGYWLESIADDAKPPFLDPALKRFLWAYIDEYEFKGVQSLCMAIRHPIILSPDEVEKLKRDVKSGVWKSAGESRETGEEATE